MLQTHVPSSLGSAERARWEALLEMEAANFQCDQSRIGATTLGVDLVKVSEKVQLRLVWKWARYFGVPKRVLWVLFGYFAHERKVMFEKNVSGPGKTITAILPGSKIILLKIVLQGATRRVL